MDQPLSTVATQAAEAGIADAVFLFNQQGTDDPVAGLGTDPHKPLSVIQMLMLAVSLGSFAKQISAQAVAHIDDPAATPELAWAFVQMRMDSPDADISSRTFSANAFGLEGGGS